MIKPEFVFKTLRISRKSKKKLHIAIISCCGQYQQLNAEIKKKFIPWLMSSAQIAKSDLVIVAAAVRNLVPGQLNPAVLTFELVPVRF